MAVPANTYFTYTMPHGPVTICATTRGICEVAFNAEDMQGKRAASSITNQAANELHEYLAGKRKYFSVALDPQGSAFQKSVWTEVANIGYGESRTAAEIAQALGKPGSHRAVGTAIRANRLAPFIPTHRIATANATGKQAKIFRALLAMEQRNIDA